uniref:Uncharacterized protein n=1 Tax=Arcella intermedia TaxID=1963864 RepID=A0A6B2LW73_9EUKA
MYLEKSGILDLFTKILTELHDQKEKPKDGKEFLKKYISSLVEVDVEQLQNENKQLKTQIRTLEDQLKQTKTPST